ncbi:hypothetical protein ACJJIX_14410 [Microbulbifer sp. VAAC004]|uniref:hypothetical protein n=1 Tax=unclassified Microbulbifer TaxID=2619833 RepID=UPI00403A2CE6
MSFHILKSVILAILFILIATSSPYSLSQAQGSGQSLISFAINEFITIEDVDDINLNPTPGAPAQGTDLFCVAGDGFPAFSIIFTGLGTGTGTPFILRGRQGAVLNYQVSFQNATSGGAPIAALPGVPITNNTLQANNCMNNNALFNVLVPASEWEPVAGMAPFRGRLLITVESE